MKKKRKLSERMIEDFAKRIGSMAKARKMVKAAQRQLKEEQTLMRKKKKPGLCKKCGGKLIAYFDHHRAWRLLENGRLDPDGLEMDDPPMRSLEFVECESCGEETELPDQ